MSESGPDLGQPAVSILPWFKVVRWVGDSVGSVGRTQVGHFGTSFDASLGCRDLEELSGSCRDMLGTCRGPVGTCRDKQSLKHLNTIGGRHADRFRQVGPRQVPTAPDNSPRNGKKRDRAVGLRPRPAPRPTPAPPSLPALPPNAPSGLVFVVVGLH